MSNETLTIDGTEITEGALANVDPQILARALRAHGWEALPGEHCWTVVSETAEVPEAGDAVVAANRKGVGGYNAVRKGLTVDNVTRYGPGSYRIEVRSVRGKSYVGVARKADGVWALRPAQLVATDGATIPANYLISTP